MTDLGNISYSLEIEFYKWGRGLMIHQRRYVSDVVKRFEMEHYNSASTPAEQRLQLTKDSDEGDIDLTQYRRFIGSLRYLCHTRPDLAYNVGMVSKFMQKPKLSHLLATKRILRHLRGTLDVILFPVEMKEGNASLLDTLILVGVVTLMIENLQ